jgi:hypothetical protein
MSALFFSRSWSTVETRKYAVTLGIGHFLTAWLKQKRLFASYFSRKALKISMFRLSQKAKIKGAFSLRILGTRSRFRYKAES